MTAALAAATPPLITDPYWWEAAPREPVSRPEVPESADAAVIGAGYAGLTAALTLAKAGRSVVVLDAEAPGWGASSRSGGMVGHGHRLSYSKLKERFGEARAGDLIREGMRQLEHLFELVSSEGIDAKLVRTGRFRGAATPADYEANARETELLAKFFGMPVEAVPRAEQGREIASGLYHGGVLFHAHGGLHPALFHAGLLAATRRAGVTVSAYAPVTAVRRDGDGFQVSHPGGTLRARDVLACTNGYTLTGLKPLARRLVGMPSYMIATEKLGQNRVRSLIPNGRMIVETRQTHLYYRPSPDGERIILGGRAALHPIPLDIAAGRLKHYLREVLPDIGDVALSHAWTGNVCMTRSDMPFIGRLDGIWHAVGCNGSGVALMPYLGRKLALKALGDPEGRTAYDGIDAPAIPLYGGKPWFLPAITAWWRFKDRREGRKPPP